MTHLPVYFVMQCSNLGGMEHVTLVTMKEMIRRGYSVSLFSITSMGGLKEELDSAQIPYFDNQYKGPFGLLSLPKLCWKLWHLPRGIIVTVGHNLSLFLALFLQRHKTPLLSMHFHHQGVMTIWSWRILYLLAWMKFRKIHFVSKYILDEALAIAPWIKSKAVMVYNAIQLPSLEEALVKRYNFRNRFRIPQDAFVIGNAGWLIRRKRWDVFIETAQRVLRKRNVHFVITGGGPDLKTIERMAAKISSAKEFIHFTGWLADMSEFYNGIDLLLFNSDFDALATTPIEAMSYGKIVVASVCKGGLYEIFPNHGGLLLNEHNCDVLAETVLKYYESALHNKNALFCEESRRYVMDNFSPEVIVNSFECLLNIVE